MDIWLVICSFFVLMVSYIFSRAAVINLQAAEIKWREANHSLKQAVTTLRLHGKSRREVYLERAKSTVRSDSGKRQVAIKRISKKKAKRDGEMHKSYGEIDLDRDRVCEGCGLNLPLSHSHLLSQQDRPDLVADKRNIRLHCFGNYKSCHDTWERGKPVELVRMLDFKENLEYIKQVDQDRYNAIVAKFEFDKVEL